MGTVGSEPSRPGLQLTINMFSQVRNLAVNVCHCEKVLWRENGNKPVAYKWMDQTDGLCLFDFNLLL